MDVSASPVTAPMLGGMLRRISDGTISGKIAKQVFEAMWSGEWGADSIIESRGLKQITDSGAIESIVDEVIAVHSGQVENYRAAEGAKQQKMLGVFVGQVMKVTRGNANPQQVNGLLKKKLTD